MVVALDETLNDMFISTLVRKGSVGWQRVEPAKTTGTDIFIGAGVTKFGETKPDIDLCAVVDALMGFVLGLAPQFNEIPAGGAYYNDFDNPIADNIWVQVGIPQQGGTYLVLSETNTTIVLWDKIYCVDGVWAVADTNDNYQMIAEEPITGAVNTRKYFYARWVKN